MSLLIKKHRPKGLEELYFHKKEAKTIQKQINQEKLPHLIISGYENTLKENFLYATAHSAYGENFKNNVEFASVEEFFSTKAKTLRQKPKYQRYFSEAREEKKRIFDKYNIDKNVGRTSKEEGFKQYIKSISRSAPVGENQYRLFVLFEAHRLTKNVQNSLRRTMENYSPTTRFAFSLKTPTSLIEAIRSRCYTINLSEPTHEEIKTKLKEITNQEEINISDEAIEAIIYLTNNDYVSSLNLIDALNTKEKEEITIKDIKKLSNKMKIRNYEKSLKKALEGKVKESINLIDELIYEENTKYSKLISEWRKTIYNLSISEKTKKELIKKLAILDKEIQELPRDPNQMKKLGRTLYEKYLSSISPE